MGQATITLGSPIPITTESGEAKLTEIKIGILRAKHLKVMPKELLEGRSVNPAKLIPLISAITGVGREYIEELAFGDFTKVVEAVTASMGEQISSDDIGKEPSGD